MMDFRAASRYARALFEIAVQAGNLEIVGAQLLDIRKLVEKHREIPHLLLNSTIPTAEKEDFISKIVPEKTLPLVVEFLKVLVKKKRFNDLVLIQKEYRRLEERKRGIKEVEAFTAVPMAQPSEARLRTVLQKKLSAEIRLVSKVDPRLIGGMVLRFEGQEINASFLSRLEDLRQELIHSNPR